MRAPKCPELESFKSAGACANRVRAEFRSLLLAESLCCGPGWWGTPGTPDTRSSAKDKPDRWFRAQDCFPADSQTTATPGISANHRRNRCSPSHAESSEHPSRTHSQTQPIFERGRKVSASATRHWLFAKLTWSFRSWDGGVSRRAGSHPAHRQPGSSSRSRPLVREGLRPLSATWSGFALPVHSEPLDRPPHPRKVAERGQVGARNVRGRMRGRRP